MTDRTKRKVDDFAFGMAMSGLALIGITLAFLFIIVFKAIWDFPISAQFMQIILTMGLTGGALMIIGYLIHIIVD